MTTTRRAAPPAKKKVPAKKTTVGIKKGSKPATVKKAGPPVKKGFPAKKGFPPRNPGVAAKKPARKPLPQFDAPADFKPHFLLVQMKTEADGLFASQAKAIRYVGKFSRDAEDKKKFDMTAYDMPTVMGIVARISAKTFKATNDKKFSRFASKRDGVKGAHRLPPNTMFQILMRVGRRAADNSLTAGIRTIWQIVKSEKTGRIAPAELEKTDPVYRLIRGANRFLPAAFANVQMPPKRSRRRAADDADEEAAD